MDFPVQSSTDTIYVSSLLQNLIVSLRSVVPHRPRDALAASELLAIIAVKVAFARAVFVRHLPLAPAALRH